MTEPVTQVAIPAAVPPAAVGFLDEVRHAGLDLQGQQSMYASMPQSSTSGSGMPSPTN